MRRIKKQLSHKEQEVIYQIWLHVDTKIWILAKELGMNETDLSKIISKFLMLTYDEVIPNRITTPLTLNHSNLTPVVCEQPKCADWKEQYQLDRKLKQIEYESRS